MTFADAATRDIFDDTKSKGARKRLPVGLWRIAQRKLDQLNVVRGLQALAIPPGNRLEALKGERAGQHSIRINDQYRVCFTWMEQGPANVEIIDYH